MQIIQTMQIIQGIYMLISVIIQKGYIYSLSTKYKHTIH